MFGNKEYKLLNDKIYNLEKENTILRKRQEDYDFLEHNSLLKIIGYDYSMLVTFSGENVVYTTIRIDEHGVNYCFGIEKNGAMVNEYVLYRGSDGGILSHIANSRRENTYNLVKAVADFVIHQITLYRDRMGYKCIIRYEDRIPEEYKISIGEMKD